MPPVKGAFFVRISMKDSRAEQEVCLLFDLSRFEACLKGRGLSDRTVASYIGDLNRFAAWMAQTCGGEFDPVSVTPLDVADYRRFMLDRGKKPATVNHALDVLRSFFAWAVSEGIVRADPSAETRRVKEQRQAPRWLDRKDLTAFVRAAQKHGTLRDQALVMLFLHAGLRVSEAVSLRTEDVTVRDRSGSVVVRRGKGDKRREVPLNVTARKVLGEYLAGLRGEWLFPGKRGKPMTARAAQKRLAGFGRLAGVEVTPHMLRHTFCKMLVDAEESLDRVAVLAGHNNLNTTARYTRPSEKDLERAVEKLSWE